METLSPKLQLKPGAQAPRRALVEQRRDGLPPGAGDLNGWQLHVEHFVDLVMAMPA